MLTYLRPTTELIGQQARWLDVIEEFDFQLKHRAGVMDGNADSLSRKSIPCEDAGRPCPQCRIRSAASLKEGIQCFAVQTRAQKRLSEERQRKLDLERAILNGSVNHVIDESITPASSAETSLKFIEEDTTRVPNQRSQARDDDDIHDCPVCQGSVPEPSCFQRAPAQPGADEGDTSIAQPVLNRVSQGDKIPRRVQRKNKKEKLI